MRETGGAICEVNAAPGFRMHTHPTIGEPQYIAKPVIDLLFPPGAPSRIPIIAVTGTNGKTTTSRMIAHIFKGMGRKVGMTSTDGVVIDERLVIRADASGPKSARMVLQNPRVDFAVFEVARGGILREGLGYDRNDVAVVLNVAADHLGMRGIDTLEQLAAVKRVVVEAVPRDGFAVLNADDPLVARDARGAAPARSSGSRWRAPAADVREMIDEHCRRGGRAVVLERSELGEMIVIRHGRRSMQLAWTHLLPGDLRRRARFNVQNAMAAAGAAFAAGAPLHDIRQGLRTFTTNYYLSPGRLNQVEVERRQRLRRLLPQRRPACARSASSSSSSPRASAAASELAKPSPDRHDRDRRRPARRGHARARAGRGRALRRRGGPGGPQPARPRPRRDRRARRGGRAGAGWPRGARCKQVEVVLDEIAAVRHCMARANPGDLVVLCVDKHGAVMAELETMRTRPRPARTSARQSPTPTCPRPAEAVSRPGSRSPLGGLSTWIRTRGVNYPDVPGNGLFVHLGGSLDAPLSERPVGSNVRCHVSPGDVRKEWAMNIVLVHGAWADGSCWSAVIEQLQANGHKVAAPQFPLKDLEGDVARLRQVLVRQSGPTLIVGHSYGGQIMTALGTDAPNAVGLVYIAGFGLDENETIGGLLKDGPTPGTAHLDVDASGSAWLPEDDFLAHFAPDVPAVKARVMCAAQQPLSFSAFGEVMGVPAWKSLPSWSMVAASDEVIPAEAERLFAQRMGAVTVEIESSHLVMVSTPIRSLT